MNEKDKQELSEFAHEKVHEALAMWAEELSEHTKSSPETKKSIKDTLKEFGKWAGVLERMTAYVDKAEKQINNCNKTIISMQKLPMWHLIWNNLLKTIVVILLGFLAYLVYVNGIELDTIITELERLSFLDFSWPEN